MLNDKLKKALNESVPSWDDDLIWEEIEKALPNKKKKRGLFWLWIPLLLLTSTFALYFYFSDFMESEKITPSLEPIASNGEVHSDIASADPIVVRSVIHNETTNKGDTDKLISDKPSLKKSISKDYTISILNTEGISPRMGKDNLSDDNFTYTSLPTFDKAKSKQEIQTTQNDIVKTSTSFHKMETLLLLPFNIKTSVSDSLGSFHKYDSGIQLNKKSSSRFYLQSNSGISYTSRILLEPANNDWISNRSNRETLLETYDFNLALQLELKSHFIASLGIGFVNTIDKITSRDTVEIGKEVIQSDSAYVVNSLFLPGNLERTSMEVYTISTPNQYRSLMVPLSLGYRFNRNRWLADVFVGSEFRIWSSFKGKFLDFDLRLIENEKLPVNFFSRGFGLSSVYVGANCAYELHQNFAVLLGMRYRRGTWDHLSSADYSLRHNNLGVSLGLRISL